MANLTKPTQLIGQSSYFANMLEQISLLAPLNKPVLVIGERGTGKELVAERLHYLSSRWHAPLIKLNCAAINDNLLESELFGHEIGSFSGASKKHIGRFARAENGSLFLDELANTSNLVQEKLLRVVEYGEYETVGGQKTLNSDVRLIAATNEDLPQLVEQKRFRADLLDRLAFDVVTIPPLRYRQEDILLLAEHFAIRMATELNLEYFAGFTDEAKETLLSYQWPGNVRELKNVIERSLYRQTDLAEALDNVIFDPFDSPFRPVKPSQITEKSTPTQINDLNSFNQAYNWPIDFAQLSAKHEIDMIKAALKQSKFNQKQAAQLLNVSYHQLRGYLKKYKLLDSLKHD
ncbi:phage shock protein operon transcriptional activator [Catenovulum sp. 2E275]|uniref:phage shock protein operon transcriptional activator n=1 Tax=Catenovulum sp. 2E275 TaxID=2980497 RepID=UPI0021D39A9F|nr:phage shock protein operon transcriptional activator [Catenovulum sp. 2E275]MCU4676736.1 phage shock protein operon transcriptional activator [Catenovulum sp. 2E275]